jgi:hypothetical protein
MWVSLLWQALTIEAEDKSAIAGFTVQWHRDTR